MKSKTETFASLTLAALLALAPTAGGAADDKKATDNDAQAQAELERKLADARKRLDEAAREVANLSMSLSDDMVPHMRGSFDTVVRGGTPRAVLGVNMGSDDAKSDGVEIVSVSPGGAAAEAGLKAGDVLTDINGTALKRDGDASAREKLIVAMRKVKPGDSVAVGYRRDNKALQANLVAQPLRNMFFTRAIPAPGIAAMPPMPDFVFMRGEGVFGSAELVPLTPKLGQYFGTETGLLVVRAPDDSRLKLEDGDVIVDIDGRTPSNASHALRILSSYQAGEKLKLNILRMKKRMSFEVTVPEDTFEKRLNGPRMERGFMRFGTPPGPMIEAVPAMPGTPGIRVEGMGPITVPAPPLPDESV
ncbi:MAG TPA: PDZ domain-containing protein [Steroidobacteraceae bacterium]|nr:PDZ domain-containing protein [Steroidobacteraceae bacterium]